MPIYEYKCQKCGHVTEQLRSMSAADDATACEECQSKETQRVQSVFAANSGGPSVPDCCPAGPMTGGGCCGGMCQGH
ncbi:MAG: zinc ribbon domain-containing protein [Phycisphaeraceae bacterium JB051]